MFTAKATNFELIIIKKGVHYKFNFRKLFKKYHNIKFASFILQFRITLPFFIIELKERKGIMIIKGKKISFKTLNL